MALEQQRLRVEVRRQESEASSTIAELRAQLQTATAQAGAAQSGDAPWWRTIKVPRVSLHDVPVWGLKVSKVRDDATRRDARAMNFNFNSHARRETRDARRERTSDANERRTDETNDA